MGVRVMTEKRKATGWKKRMFEQVAERDGRQCAQCRDPFRVLPRPGGLGNTWDEHAHLLTKIIWASNLELDHKLALHAGGSNEIDNLWLLCRSCHRLKTSAEQSARLKALGAGRNAQ